MRLCGPDAGRDGLHWLGVFLAVPGAVPEPRPGPQRRKVAESAGKAQQGTDKKRRCLKLAAAGSRKNCIRALFTWSAARPLPRRCSLRSGKTSLGSAGASRPARCGEDVRLQMNLGAPTALLGAPNGLPGASLAETESTTTTLNHVFPRLSTSFHLFEPLLFESTTWTLFHVKHHQLS